MTQKPEIRRIVTHDGRFHADEVFAVAAILILYPDAKVVRTRNDEIIRDAIEDPHTIVIDVGRTFNPKKLCFDHHQADFAGTHYNHMPMAAFGLVWECVIREWAGISGSAWQYIEQRLVLPIDISDCGFRFARIEGVAPFTIQDIVHFMRPKWNDQKADPERSFGDMVQLAQFILKRALEEARAIESAKPLIDVAIRQAADPRIIVLDQVDLPLPSLPRKAPAARFIVFPNDSTESGYRWCVRPIIDPETRAPRHPFPAPWLGKEKRALQDLTGVLGAGMCHRNGIVLLANSKGAAIAIAKQALASPDATAA